MCICLAPSNSVELRRVISGIAISYSVEDRELVVYFGCAAQVDVDDLGPAGMIGGAGVVRLPAYGVWPARVTPVRLNTGSRSETINAGAMFIVDQCAGFSDWKVASSLAVSKPKIERWGISGLTFLTILVSDSWTTYLR